MCTKDWPIWYVHWNPFLVGKPMYKKSNLIWRWQGIGISPSVRCYGKNFTAFCGQEHIKKRTANFHFFILIRADLFLYKPAFETCVFCQYLGNLSLGKHTISNFSAASFLVYSNAKAVSIMSCYINSESIIETWAPKNVWLVHHINQQEPNYWFFFT